jgi:hypothetical protein
MGQDARDGVFPCLPLGFRSAPGELVQVQGLGNNDRPSRLFDNRKHVGPIIRPVDVLPIQAERFIRDRIEKLLSEGPEVLPHIAAAR